MKKKTKIFLSSSLGILCLLITIYFCGPTPPKPELDKCIPTIELSGDDLDKFVSNNESKVKFIKPGNRSQIVWYDSINKSKTTYSVVYIHGFSASHEEGNAIHRAFANRYGSNLYLPRLSGHGITEKEPMLHLTPEKLLKSAKEAIAIAKALGDKVILMSTSTGSTLSLYLASGNPDIYGLILYSPNIDLYDSRSFLLTKPWGLQIARMVNGSENYHFNGPPGVDSFWTTSYRIEGLIALKMLLQETMTTETFNKIKQPVLVSYYPSDDVVSVPAIQKMFVELGTNTSEKVLRAFPEAGTHAIASRLWSRNTEKIKVETFRFAEEVLKMKRSDDAVNDFK